MPLPFFTLVFLPQQISSKQCDHTKHTSGKSCMQLAGDYKSIYCENFSRHQMNLGKGHINKSYHLTNLSNIVILQFGKF